VPIKSKAQRRKFAQLLVEGKISADAFERWNRDAGSTDLPEHVKRKGKKKSAKKSSRARKKK
jgi:hypothetical protein